MKHKIETRIFENKILQATLLINEYNEIVQTLAERAIDTQDNQVREALISLGWTPPKEENKKGFKFKYENGEKQ